MTRLSTWYCPHLLLSAVLRRRCCWAPAAVDRTWTKLTLPPSCDARRWACPWLVMIRPKSTQYIQQLKDGIVGGSSLKARQEPAVVSRPVDQCVVSVAVRANCCQTHRAVLVCLIVWLSDHCRPALDRPLSNHNRSTIRQVATELVATDRIADQRRPYCVLLVTSGGSEDWTCPFTNGCRVYVP